MRRSISLQQVASGKEIPFISQFKEKKEEEKEKKIGPQSAFKKEYYSKSYYRETKQCINESFSLGSFESGGKVLFTHFSPYFQSPKGAILFYRGCIIDILITNLNLLFSGS